MKRRLALGLALAALAQVPCSSAQADQTAPKEITCLEKIPQGAKRPTVEEKFPGEVIAGYEASLDLEIKHGKGETPLASGFRIASGSEAEKALKSHGFLIAEPDAGGEFSITTETDGDKALSKVRIPVIVAPTQSGTRSMILPQLPISVSRANGETMTFCTRVHLVTVTDPTAGEEDPKPHPNPPARAQIEPWPMMWWILAGVVLALLVIGLLIRYIRKQMALAAPGLEKQKRLPWEEALLELEALKASPLYDSRSGAGAIRAELFDRISDTVRKYLGARYGFDGLGFDGLETTTNEMMTLLGRVRPGIPRVDLIQTFLGECDLVKFARVEPAIDDCDQALSRAVSIVQATTPLPGLGSPSPEEPPRAPPPAPPPARPLAPMPPAFSQEPPAGDSPSQGGAP
jgi:hypothetical protein